jgi:hypothetical protein
MGSSCQLVKSLRSRSISLGRRGRIVRGGNRRRDVRVPKLLLLFLCLNGLQVFHLPGRSQHFHAQKARQVAFQPRFECNAHHRRMSRSILKDGQYFGESAVLASTKQVFDSQIASRRILRLTFCVTA